MNKILFFGLCLALLAGACEQARRTNEMPLNAALARVDKDGISAHLAYLSDDALEGRESGKPGYDKAAAYVAGQFAALDLEPGGDDGWYQQLPLVAYQYDADNVEVMLHHNGTDSSLVYLEDFSGIGDRVRTETSVRAEVVYAGFGVHAPEFGYSDYAGIDVNGKIVALFDNAPALLPGDQRAYYSSWTTKYHEATARGAVGIVIVRSQRAAESFPWERIRQTAGNDPGMTWVDPASGAAAAHFPELLGRTYLSASGAQKLFAAGPVSFDKARAAIEADAPTSVPLGIDVTIAVKTHHEKVESANVIGIVRGSDPALADEYVVFTAHLDAMGIDVTVEGSDDVIVNGAYDNAMGIALMLEAAEAIAANPPRRSVMFIALAAEEQGLLGSDYFSHYPTVPLAAIVANVNLDMPLFLYPIAELVDYGAAHTSIKTPLAEAAAAEGFTLVPDPIPEENSFVRSDQYSFVRKGVPAANLNVGFGSTDTDIDGKALYMMFLSDHYHKPSDDLSRFIDWDSAVRFARVNTRLGIAIGNADARPTWNDGDFFGEKFGRDR